MTLKIAKVSAMGDISELRGLIVTITFLGVTGLLIAWMPAELFTASEYRTVGVPEFFESVDVWSYAETFIYQMNETGGYSYGSWYQITNDGLDIGGRDFMLDYKRANQTPLYLFLRHKWYWFIFTQFERMEWLNYEGISRGTELSVEEMQEDAELPDNATCRYRVISPDEGFQYVASFGYNSTLYSNFTQAWNYHGLHFFWAVNFDQQGTSFNVVQLIGMLIFFQMPAGMPAYINALIAIPFWVCVAYLVYVLIIKIIPFIAGG